MQASIGNLTRFVLMQYVLLCVMFCRSLFFFSLCSLSVLDLRLLSISLWYLQTFLQTKHLLKKWWFQFIVRHDITEILLKVALNTINQTNQFIVAFLFIFTTSYSRIIFHKYLLEKCRKHFHKIITENHTINLEDRLIIHA